MEVFVEDVVVDVLVEMESCALLLSYREGIARYSGEGTHVLVASHCNSH